jgi:hypothetical protein
MPLRASPMKGLMIMIGWMLSHGPERSGHSLLPDKIPGPRVEGYCSRGR